MLHMCRANAWRQRHASTATCQSIMHNLLPCMCLLPNQPTQFLQVKCITLHQYFRQCTCACRWTNADTLGTNINMPACQQYYCCSC
jgi:hypothetical protein